MKAESFYILIRLLYAFPWLMMVHHSHVLTATLSVFKSGNLTTLIVSSSDDGLLLVSADETGSNRWLLFKFLELSRDLSFPVAIFVIVGG